MSQSLEKEFEEKGMQLKDFLKEQIKNGLSRPQIAEQLRCSLTTIRFYTEKYKIKFPIKKSSWCRNLFKEKK